MSSPELDEALAAYHRSREDLARLQRELADVSATATAPRKVVSITMSRQGEITDVAFPTNAYRNMTPTELAAAIVKTAADARAEVRRKSSALLAPLLPSEVDTDAVLAGTADLTAMVPTEPRMGQP